MGRVLGLDPGRRRIGVAVSDPMRITASPVGFVDAEPKGLADRLRALAGEWEPDLVVIGLPVSLDGAEGASANLARELGDLVERTCEVDVHYVDERFTSLTAERALIEGGVRRRRRKDLRDGVAASLIVRAFLDGAA